MKTAIFIFTFLLFTTSCILLTSSTSTSAEQKAITEGPENGTLLIIGGAAQDIFFEKFMELIGGPNEPIVVIPTAASSKHLDKEFLNSCKNRFVKKGFKNVTVLHTRDRKESNSQAFISPIEKAKGVLSLIHI